jgi:hypothetical protein
MTARDHFKSTSLYADIMKDIWDLKHNPMTIEGQYFSYTRPMGAYHVNKIHDMIRVNPYFKDCKDLKPSADSILDYTWDGKHRFTLQPQGLLTFTRGIHCDRIYIDDGLKDPENKLILTNILKINNIIKSVVFPMLKKGGKFRIVGTPQSWVDIYFDNKALADFKKQIIPAIIKDDPINPIVAWPEWMTYDVLKEILGKIGPKLFGPEYLVTPVHSELAFFTRDKLESVINSNRKNLLSYSTTNDVIMGLDVGKKVHPSHLVIHEWTGRCLLQLYEEFLDDMDYTDQVDHLNDLWAVLGCTGGFYDGTRGELDPFKEQNILPQRFEPVIFSTLTKTSMATAFDTFVANKEMELIDSDRQTEQILMVDNNLKAPETVYGHGDSFWSNALVCYYVNKKLIRSSGKNVLYKSTSYSEANKNKSKTVTRSSRIDRLSRNRILRRR